MLQNFAYSLQYIIFSFSLLYLIYSYGSRWSKERTFSKNKSIYHGKIWHSFVNKEWKLCAQQNLYLCWIRHSLPHLWESKVVLVHKIPLCLRILWLYDAFPNLFLKIKVTSQGLNYRETGLYNGTLLNPSSSEDLIL